MKKYMKWIYLIISIILINYGIKVENIISPNFAKFIQILIALFRNLIILYTMKKYWRGNYEDINTTIHSIIN